MVTGTIIPGNIYLFSKHKYLIRKTKSEQILLGFDFKYYTNNLYLSILGRVSLHFDKCFSLKNIKKYKYLFRIRIFNNINILISSYIVVKQFDVSARLANLALQKGMINMIFVGCLMWSRQLCKVDNWSACRNVV